MEDEIIITSNVWKAGSGTLVLTIGKNIEEMFNINDGDMIIAKVIAIHKGKKEKSCEKERPQEEEKVREKRKFILN